MKLPSKNFAFKSILIALAVNYSAPAMSECSHESNRELIERLFYSGFSGGDVAVLEEVFHEQIEFYDPAFPPGLEGIKQLVAKNNQSFDDWQFTIHQIICSGEYDVVVRWTGNGIHARPWMGESPTQNNIDLNGISIYRIEDNKIVADWVMPDNLGFLMQIGVLSPIDLTQKN